MDLIKLKKTVLGWSPEKTVEAFKTKRLSALKNDASFWVDKIWVDYGITLTDERDKMKALKQYELAEHMSDSQRSKTRGYENTSGKKTRKDRLGSMLNVYDQLKSRRMRQYMAKKPSILRCAICSSVATALCSHCLETPYCSMKCATNDLDSHKCKSQK